MKLNKDMIGEKVVKEGIKNSFESKVFEVISAEPYDFVLRPLDDHGNVIEGANFIRLPKSACKEEYEVFKEEAENEKHTVCKRCGRRLKNEKSTCLGMGMTCYKKYASSKNKLF